MFLPLILGGAAAAAKMATGFFQNAKANQIDPKYTPYQVSPYAKQQLDLAKTMFGGRMFGAPELEQNILASQSNYLNNVNRNASDSGQALAMGALAQGQTNQNFQDLQIQELQNKYNMLNNLNQGYQGMIEEGDKVYQDMINKYQIDMEQKNALRDSAFSNIFGGVNDIAGGLIQGNTLGWFNKGAGEEQQRYQFPNAFDPSLADTPNQPGYTPGMVNTNAMNKTMPSYGVNLYPYGIIGPTNR